MPDLGKYAEAVLWSWAATILLIGALVVATALRARRSKVALLAAETRAKAGKEED
ncbi:MAG: heme exporter protein CcmD [Maritimibacter sp.]